MIPPISPGYQCWPPETSWIAFAVRIDDRQYPWDDEVDGDGKHLMSYPWITKSGLPAYAARDPYLGCWGGYVGVLPGHTLHGRGAPAFEPGQGTHSPSGIGEPRLPDIPTGIHSRVHDGIKYAGPIPGLDTDQTDLWWLGFRCDGCTDYTPGYDFWNPDVDYYDSTWPQLLNDRHGDGRRVYRTLAYVREVAESFAADLTRSTRPVPRPEQ